MSASSKIYLAAYFFALSLTSINASLLGESSLSDKSSERKDEKVFPIRGGKLQKVNGEISAEMVFHRYQDEKGIVNVYLYKKQYIPVPPTNIPLKGEVQFDDGKDPLQLDFSSKGDHYNTRFNIDKAVENFKITLIFTVDGNEKKLTFDQRK